jgi:hypothetical protein
METVFPYGGTLRSSTGPTRVRRSRVSEPLVLGGMLNLPFLLCKGLLHLFYRGSDLAPPRPLGSFRGFYPL